MFRSLQMESKRYRSLGKCIFCLSEEISNLTDEHIVPEALSGEGQMIIEKGSCRSCNGYANETYEQQAMQTDFLPIRTMLSLKRKSRGRQQKPRKMRPVSYAPYKMAVGDAGFDVELPTSNHPRFADFIVHGPAGKLVGTDLSKGMKEIRLFSLDLGRNGSITPQSVTTRNPHIAGKSDMVIAKMAYCYAVAERGLNGFDFTEIRDLLMGRRQDIFNFVGKPVVEEKLAMLRLHKFYFRKRDHLNTVIVHLFASFGGPKHEVVLGPDAN